MDNRGVSGVDSDDTGVEGEGVHAAGSGFEVQGALPAPNKGAKGV